MPIIQYVLPSKNKQLKKLLHFYWEVCKKKDDHGKLKQEMILVWYVVFSMRFILWHSFLALSNAIRNDLVSVAIFNMVQVIQFRAAPP
jgi:vesicle coat complex subunit